MLLIGNGKVFTRDSNCPYIENGAILIEGELIKDVGKTIDLKNKYPQAKFKDAKNRLIMPGFINTHQHYYSTFARGLFLNGKPATMFSQILEGLWWRLDKALTLDDVYYSAIIPMIEEIKCGVTTSIDHHASPFAVRGSLFKIAEAAKKMGLRRNLCYETSDRDGENICNEGISENIDFAKFCKRENNDMIKSMFGLHASMTISKKTLEKCINAANDNNLGFHFHAAEGIEDVADSLSKYKIRVIERWFKAGVLNKKSIAVHCIHITEEEINILKNSGISIVHNPESNMGNAVGVAPILKMMSENILVGLGTDGYSFDILESYKVSNIIHKHEAKLPSVGWIEPPKMLFDNNKKIVERQINGSIGILKKNSYADIIIVDYKPFTPINKDNINGHILFGISGRNVDTTICNGNIIMEERKLVNIDEEEIVSKAKELSESLWNRI